MQSSKTVDKQLCPVRRVYAWVVLQPLAEREEILERARGRMGRARYEEWLAAVRSPDDLNLLVSLSAEDHTGRRIDGNGCFGIGGPRRGLGAMWERYHGPPLPGSQKEQNELLERTYRVGKPDIEDAINQMLGRDPDLDPPPELSWCELHTNLSRAGIAVSERELVSVPLIVELDPQLVVDLQKPCG